MQEHPNAKVTFDQMSHVRTQDSICEVPQATTMIEAHLSQVLLEGKTAKTVLDELQRPLTALADGVKK